MISDGDGDVDDDDDEDEDDDDDDDVSFSTVPNHLSTVGRILIWNCYCQVIFDTLKPFVYHEFPHENCHKIEHLPFVSMGLGQNEYLNNWTILGCFL